MIVRPRPSFGRLFFILRGSIVQRIYPQILGVMVVSAIVVLGHREAPDYVPSVAGAPFADRHRAVDLPQLPQQRLL